MEKNIGIFYFRSLYSQSAASLSIGRFSDYLLNRGYNTKIYLLRQDNCFDILYKYNEIVNKDVIIYKTNYKDFEYGIRIFENLMKGLNKKFYLVGPFAVMNKEQILKKYNFITNIINIQDKKELEDIFSTIGEPKKKDSIVCGIDREIELQEKGRYINLEASSGCIYNCSFCHIKLMNYEKYTKNIDDLVNEIDELVNKMGKKYLIFNDSVFWKNSSDDKRIYDFIKKIKEKNIKFYFMIYLSLTIMIPDELLRELKSIGLIRVFFGVENISTSFSKENNKYISEQDTDIFIDKLESYNISYHIGFILFSPYTKYEDLIMNLKYLHKIKKLFRPGIIIEKMRILPNSKDCGLLKLDESKIDQAYNYKIFDERVEKYYNKLISFFSNINIRKFEQYFSGINIAKTILIDMGKDYKYLTLFNEYNDTLNMINDSIYNILVELLNKDVDNNDVEKLYNLYSLAEINYVKFMSYLNNNDEDVYLMIPHGHEELNI